MTVRPTIQTRTLQRARDLLGGRPQLAHALKAPLTDIHQWLTGSEQPPTWVFLRAVDLVNDAEDALYAQMRKEQPAAPHAENTPGRTAA